MQQLRVFLRNSLRLTNIAASAQLVVPLASRIDISRYSSVVVSVKVFSVTINGAATLDIVAIADASTDWASIQGSTPLATVSLDSSTSQNSVLVDSLAGDLPAMIALIAQATQDANQQTIEAEIEVDLVLREQ